jgi:hypothetical protein
MKIVKEILAWVLCIGLAVAISFSCTQGARVRHWGFKSTIVLPPGRKLVNVTWKASNMWTLTRPAAVNESSNETWYMDEFSSWGILSGRLILQETPK